MVSNYKLAIFMVGLIISFSMAVYAIVKTRKYPGVMKLIMIGVLTSLIVTVFRNVIVVLSVGLVPTLFQMEQAWVNFIILFVLEAGALMLVHWILMSRILKTKLDKTAALAVTLGYLLNVTLANILMYANHFAGSFAFNSGELVELLGEKGAASFEALVVLPHAFYHLTMVLFILVTWLLFAKVFTFDDSIKREQRTSFLLLAYHSFLTVLIATHALPSIVLLVIIVVTFVLLIRDYKKA